MKRGIPMKRICSLLLTVAMIVTFCVALWSPVSAAQFTDVRTSDYYNDAVNWAVKNGITAGTSATTFGPNVNCTRAQVVTFLWRANGSPRVTASANPFIDVRVTDYFYQPVLWAVANGITAGTTANTFDPNKICTRAQVVTFLWRNEGSPALINTSSRFRDVTTADYYNIPVQWAVANKITAGTSTNYFSPNANCTRAQVVTFLYKAKDGATIIQPENDSKKAYEPIITNTVKMLKGQSYDANYVADNKHLNRAKGKADGVGYCLIDLDRDGSEELLIGDINTIDRSNPAAEDFYMYFWVMYTVVNGYPKQIVSSEESNAYYLADDGNVYRVYTNAEGENWEKMTFKDHDLQVVECAFRDGSQYCYSDLGEGVPQGTTDARRTSASQATVITKDQWTLRTTAWNALIDKPPYVAITKF